MNKQRFFKHLFLFVFFLVLALPVFGWWNASYGYRMQLDTDVNASAGGSLGNFVGLVHLNSTDHADFFSHIPSTNDFNGIEFVDGDDSTTIDWHGEDINSTDAYMWVEIPTVDYTSSDKIYIYYDDSLTTTNNESEAGTYSSDFNAVYHSNDASTQLSDSTSNSHNASGVNTPTYQQTGKIGYGVDLERTNAEYFNMNFNLDGETDMTVIMWIKLEQLPSTQSDRYLFWGSYNGNDRVYGRIGNNDGSVEHYYFEESISGSYYIAEISNNVHTNWMMITAVFDGGNNVYSYIDNNTAGKGSDSADSSLVVVGDDWYLGALESGGSSLGDELDGLVDEVKFLSKALSEDEIRAYFKSEGSQDFFTVNAEESGGAAPTATITATWLSPDQGYFSGNLNLEFRVYDSNNNDVFADLNYWQTPGGSETAVLNDFNVADWSNIANLTCDGTDLNAGTGIDCNYVWDTTVPSDGNYYVDLNIWEDVDTNNISNDGSGSFMIDNSAPTTTDDHNAGWQAFDANVSLSCSDGSGSGCSSTDNNIGLVWKTGTSVDFNTGGASSVEQTTRNESRNDDPVGQEFIPGKGQITGLSIYLNSGSGTLGIKKSVSGSYLKSCNVSGNGWVDCNFATNPLTVRSDSTYVIVYNLSSGTYDSGNTGDDPGPYADGRYWAGGVDWHAIRDLAFKIYTKSDGNYILGYRSTDVAGNTETEKTVWVAVDGTNPTLSSLTPADQSRTDSTTVSWDVNDATSGVADINVTVNGSPSTDFDFSTDCSSGGTGYYCSYSETSFNYGENTLRVDSNDNATNVVTQSNDFNYGYDPDVNVVSPNGGETWTGAQQIDFNISHQSNHELHAHIAYSASAGAFSNDLNADLNLNNYTAINGLDCSGTDWTTDQNCSYDWNSWDAPDGSYYIDINVWSNSTNLFNVDSSDATFDTDNEPVYDVNFVWTIDGNLDPENGVNTVSIDANARIYTHNVSISSYQWDENSATISTDENILHTDANVGDRNFALTVTLDYDFNSDSFTDTNWQTLHINQYPQSLDFNNASIAANYTQDFNATATDNGTIQTWFWDFNDGSYAYDQNTTHSFSSTGDFNVCFEVQDSEDLNKTHCETVTVFGAITFHFYDETDLSTIEPTVNFQDTNYTATGGTFTQELSGLGATSSSYTFTAWDANRSERSLEFDLNKYSNLDLNWLLLDKDIGKEISFTFYEPNESTLLANAEILIKLDMNYIELGSTDSSAEATFFLDTNNSAYTFHITAADGNTYTYEAVTVTVKIPKDEGDLTTEITPFEIGVGGLAKFDDVNNYADTNFYILGNTTEYYEIKVGDWNAGNYFDRYYYVRVIGGTATYTIQPYLVSGDEGMLSVLHARDTMNNPVKDVRFVVQKQLNDVEPETVETVKTDDTGRGVVSWILNDTYYVQVYYETTYQGELEIKPSLSDYYVEIKTDVPTIESTGEGPIIYMRYTSTSMARLGLSDTNQYNFDVNLYSPTSSMQSATITVQCADSNVHTETKTVNVADSAKFHVDLNASDVNACNQIQVTVTAETSQGTFSREILYGLVEEILTPFSDLKDTIGTNAVRLLALFLTSVVVGSLAFYTNPNPISMGIVAGTMLGFFTAIGWFPLTWFVFVAVVGGVLAFMQLRWEWI